MRLKKGDTVYLKVKITNTLLELDDEGCYYDCMDEDDYTEVSWMCLSRDDKLINKPDFMTKQEMLEDLQKPPINVGETWRILDNRWGPQLKTIVYIAPIQVVYKYKNEDGTESVNWSHTKDFLSSHVKENL